MTSPSGHDRRSLDEEEGERMLKDPTCFSASMSEDSGRYYQEDYETLLRHDVSKRRKKGWYRPACLLSCSLTLNAVVLIMLAISLADQCYFRTQRCSYLHSENARQTQGVSDLKLMGEVNGLVPEFPLETRVFMNDSRYASEDMFTDRIKYTETLENWNQLMPIGRGFVTIENASQYELPRPWNMAGGRGDGYSIASLHQIHCLYMIMRSHGHHRLGIPMGKDQADMERHVTHCFDYLRQSAQCAGDSALEGKSEFVEDKTDGWGNMHVCKNFDAEVQWVIDNRFSDLHGID